MATYTFNNLTSITNDEISKYSNFPSQSYYNTKKTKKQIVIHHTVSGSGIGGDITSWINNANKISTAYIIDREGKITQLFDPDNWSYHLGIPSETFKKFNVTTNNATLNAESIGIELDNWGGLIKQGINSYITSYKSVINLDDNNVTHYSNGYRGFNYFESYTDKQLSSLGRLLLYLCKKYNISNDYHDNMFEQNAMALNQTNGIWSHSSFRNDKSDAHPDPNLITLLKTVANVNMDDIETPEEVAPDIEENNNEFQTSNTPQQSGPTVPKYEWKPNTSAPNGGVQTDNEDIVKIFVDSTVPKKIVLDELSISMDELSTNREFYNSINVIGINYPLIKINDYIVPPNEIQYFEIESIDFLPKIKIILKPKSDIFLYKNSPKDGDIISIIVRPTNDILKPIRNDYVITGVFTGNRNTSNLLPNSLYTITLQGELFIPYIQSDSTSFGFLGTSKEALRDAAIRLGIGFATNDLNNTDDKQVWLCYKNTLINYINQVTNHSWKDSNSFYSSWIDFYYNLNFINVNKFLLSTENDFDIVPILNNDGTGYIWSIKNKPDQVLVTDKIFTDFKIGDNTPFYINNWNVNNRSTYITFNVGTEIQCQFFNHNQNLYNGNEKQLIEISNTPCYDKEKLNSYILLRGRANFDGSNGNAIANYSYTNYIKSPWNGIQYVMSDADALDQNNSNNTWSGNCHKNYSRSNSFNYINNKELEKITINIESPGQNLAILRGEKIPVILSDKNILSAFLNNPKSINTTNSNIYTNRFYSGWYIVLGYKIYWSYIKEYNEKNNFKTSIILGRREWPTPDVTGSLNLN